MGNFVNTIDVLGDDFVFDSIVSINGKLTEFKDDVITKVGLYAFFNSWNLKTVDLPNVISVEQHAFDSCLSLISLNMPNVESIGGYAFSRCGGSLADVCFPKVTNLSNYALYQIHFRKIVLPSVVTLNNDALFNDCRNMEILDFYNLSNISGKNLIGNSDKLKAFVIRSTTMCSLSYAYALKYSAIENKTCYIYVPRAFLNDTDSTMDYRQANNWSKYATQFRALEDYTVDGTITGELDESKI